MLEGIRVVELGVWVAGPATAGLLADWGASVIKVEPPGGDPMRGLFQVSFGSDVPHNPPFDLDNRGKRSVVLDLAQGEGRRALEKILATADVFVSNMRPAALERLGLGPARLMEEYPRLVCALITGYGREGAERDRAGYDVGAFWARSGAADLFRTTEQPPLPLRGGFGDHVTALATTAGVLAALFERERTGKGRLVETSLLATGMYCIGWDLAIQLVYDKLRATLPRSETDNPLVNCYRAGDGAWFWLIGLEGDRHFPPLCRAIEREEWLHDERFTGPRERRMNRRELIASLDGLFAEAPREEWARRFDREGVWWVPVQTPAEAIADPQALANGVVALIEAGDGQEGSRTISGPVRFGAAAESRTFGAVPSAGEHTRAVLAEAGLDTEEIEAVLALRRSRTDS